MKCSFFNMLSEMDGSNFQISNFMKMQYFLLSVPLDDFTTVLEFFHWLTSRCNASAGLIFSNITLLIFPSSLFKGLMRRQGKLAWKVSLWSFRVKSADFFTQHYTLSTRSNIFCFQIDFLFKTFCMSFVFVTFSFRSFLYCSGGALYILSLLS